METKFNIGQEVWGIKINIFKDHASAYMHYGMITKISLKKEGILYSISDSMSEYESKNLFLTKEEAQEQLSQFWKLGE